jgi:hypothetical protein
MIRSIFDLRETQVKAKPRPLCKRYDWGLEADADFFDVMKVVRRGKIQSYSFAKKRAYPHKLIQTNEFERRPKALILNCPNLFVAYFVPEDQNLQESHAEFLQKTYSYGKIVVDEWWYCWVP